MPSRVRVEQVSPASDVGPYAIKRVIGDVLRVEADLICDGHDVLAGRVLFRPHAEQDWREVRLEPLRIDRYRAALPLTALGVWQVVIEGCVDSFATWYRALERKRYGGTAADVVAHLRQGAAVLRATAGRSEGRDRGLLLAAADRLDAAERSPELAGEAAQDPVLHALATRYPPFEQAGRSEVLELVVEPQLARFSAWYEFFPRSTGARGEHGTFRTSLARLQYAAELGFDVVYLPPIHPIGRTHRKGKNNAESAGPADPGSPWAIGAAEGGHKSNTLGMVQRFVPSEGIAWEVTLEGLARAFEVARALAAEQVKPQLPSGDLLDSTRQAPPASIHAFLSEYAPFAALLGRRTAELHLALAGRTDLAACAPEPFTLDYQESLVQATRARIAQGFELLGQQLEAVPEQARPLADMVLHERAALESQLDVLDRVRVRASRIRCHGDYHLGQVLYADHDFTLLDFEGEPAQPMAARRQKLSALYDVAGMLRSFHYAVTFVLQSERWSPRERAVLGPWAQAWYRWSSAAFLCGYLRAAREHGPAVFLPEDPAELRALFRLHTLDKCSYELSYELNNRPAWVGVPLAGLHSLVAST